MAISDENRRRFTTIGLENIERELILGDVRFLPVSSDTRTQAAEWVTEEKLRVQAEQEARAAIENGRFRMIRNWTVIAGVAGAVAAAAGIVAAIASVIAVLRG